MVSSVKVFQLHAREQEFTIKTQENRWSCASTTLVETMWRCVIQAGLFKPTCRYEPTLLFVVTRPTQDASSMKDNQYDLHQLFVPSQMVSRLREWEQMHALDFNAEMQRVSAWVYVWNGQTELPSPSSKWVVVKLDGTDQATPSDDAVGAAAADPSSTDSVTVTTELFNRVMTPKDWFGVYGASEKEPSQDENQVSYLMNGSKYRTNVTRWFKEPRKAVSAMAQMPTLLPVPSYSMCIFLEGSPGDTQNVLDARVTGIYLENTAMSLLKDFSTVSLSEQASRVQQIAVRFLVHPPDFEHPSPSAKWITLKVTAAIGSCADDVSASAGGESVNEISLSPEAMGALMKPRDWINRMLFVVY